MKYVIAVLLLVPTVVLGEGFTTNNPTKAIEELSKRMYKHYEVDDTINGYVLNKIQYGWAIVGPSETKSDANTGTSKFPQRKKAFKQKVVLKSKNKMYWRFHPEHSFTINPSSLNALTYSWKDVGSVVLKEDAAYAEIVYRW